MTEFLHFCGAVQRAVRHAIHHHFAGIFNTTIDLDIKQFEFYKIEMFVDAFAQPVHLLTAEFFQQVQFLFLFCRLPSNFLLLFGQFSDSFLQG